MLVDRSIVWLDEPGAADARLSGAKAANLAVARQNGLPTYDGFVITAPHAAALVGALSTAGDVSVLAEGSIPLDSVEQAAVRSAWALISHEGAVPLAVRSSSVIEDSADSSMAGRFLTVLDVEGWEAFVAATAEVVASAAAVADQPDGQAPMAVLVQPMGDARIGGVLFGVDPLSGGGSDYLVSFVEGAPEQIVSGAVDGTQLRLGRRGAIRTPGENSTIGSRDRKALAGLAGSAARIFGGPQDIEWLIDDAGTLRLLQSRPITASAQPVRGGHILGSGPVAETFPDPLSRLERDLWEEPLDAGIREALRISGAVSNRALGERFVVDVGGRVAVDLEALGVVTPPLSWWRRLDPLPPARRLRAAWRIGRLRVALPGIAHDLVTEVDDDLRSLDALDQLGDMQLLTVLDNARRTLAGLHAHEVMSGFFLDPATTTTTGASVALATVARARLDGMDDGEIIASHPLALALFAPRIGGEYKLPVTDPVTNAQRETRSDSGETSDPMAVARESLRLRVRWVQELSAQVSVELGSRLHRRSQIDSPLDVRHLDLSSLRAAVETPASRVVLAAEPPEVPPLPARFRLATDGSVVPVIDAPGGAGGGDGPLGVSGGRVVGIVTHDPLAAKAKVLVVRSLDPALAGAIASVAGLISETGSPLSHLAILAREYGVPAVAAMPGATAALHDGDVVLLDGTAGTVEIVSEQSLLSGRGEMSTS